MVHSQVGGALTTVLAGVIVSPQDLAFRQPDARPRPADHLFEADNRRSRVAPGNCLDLTAAVQHYVRFSIEDEANRAAGVAYVDRLKVRVEDEYWGVHRAFRDSRNYSTGCWAAVNERLAILCYTLYVRPEDGL